MKIEDKKKLLYDYKVDMMGSKYCFPVILPDNAIKTVITIDEALKILNKIIITED